MGHTEPMTAAEPGSGHQTGRSATTARRAPAPRSPGEIEGRGPPPARRHRSAAVPAGRRPRARHGVVGDLPLLPEPRRPAHGADRRRVRRSRRARRSPVPQRRGADESADCPRWQRVVRRGSGVDRLATSSPMSAPLRLARSRLPRAADHGRPGQPGPARAFAVGPQGTRTTARPFRRAAPSRRAGTRPASASRGAASSAARSPPRPRRSAGGPVGGPAPGPAAAAAERGAPAESGTSAEAGTPAVPPDVLVRAVIAWTQLFGMISFELFGQFACSAPG